MAVKRVRTDVKTDKTGVLIDWIPEGGVFAICIGPESDVDECIILPNGVMPDIPTPIGLTGTINWQASIHPEAIHVSVERPFIGNVQGPFRVLYPYARGIVGSSSPRRLRPYDDTLWFNAGSRFEARRMGIELEFHDCMPSWLPTKRAPLKVPFRYPSFGTTGLSDVDMLIPVMGRRDLQLGIEGTLITSGGGSLTWSVAGLVVIENTDSALQLSISETLVTDTVESADFEKSYDFDGEFDVLWIRVDETTALGNNVAVSGYVKAWD